METVSAFSPEVLAPYLLCGGSLGFLAGVVAVMCLRRTPFFRRSPRFWNALAKADHLWLPLAFAGGFVALAGVFGMSHQLRSFVSSDAASVSRSAADSVDAVLEEVAGRIRGSGMGEEAFPEIVRVTVDAASEGVYRGLAANPGYSAVLGPARRRVRALLQDFIGREIREAAVNGAVTDASVLCEVARPILKGKIMGGAAEGIALEASSGLFTRLYLYALAAFALLCSPSVLEYLCYALFRSVAETVPRIRR
jgi:hypothetical protein